MVEPTDRRSFLKTSLLGAASLATAGCSRPWLLEEAAPAVPRSVDPPPPGATPAEAPSAAGSPATRPVLASIQGPGLPQDLATALSRLLAPLGGMGAFVTPGQTVLLKPNLGFGKPPELRAVTTPALIAAAARLALDQGARQVIVADHPVPLAGDVIGALKLREVLRGLDVTLINASDEGRWVETPIPDGRELGSTDVLAAALEADVHIALPIAKSHSGAGFTGALKGMMGLIDSRVPFHTLHDLHQAIVDLNTILKPDLVIMDGQEIMATGGPGGPGELVRCDTLIASTDPVAADAAGVRLAPLFGRRVAPGRIRHLRLAADQGLGRLTLPVEQRAEIALPATAG